MEYWNDGMMVEGLECWKELLEWWNGGMMEYWVFDIDRYSRRINT